MEAQILERLESLKNHLVEIFLTFSCFFVLAICVSATNAGDSQLGLELQDGWMDCGGASWYLNNSASDIHSPSLKSGPIENSGVSRICRIVKGPATISFLWKTDANYQGLGHLNFLVNGEQKYTCDSRDWKPMSFELRYDGEYILTWEFIKYRSYPQNFGAGWIDDIQIASKDRIYSQNLWANNTTPIFNYYNISIPINYTFIFAEIRLNTSSNKSKVDEGHLANNSHIIFVKDYDDPNNNIFSSIGGAIEKANAGDTIKISKNIYEEKVNLTKSLKLIGEDRNSSIIRGNLSKMSVIYVTANNVTIQNLTIESGEKGVCVNRTSGFQLINNNINNCKKGGVLLIDSNNLTIQGNKFYGCGSGINDYYMSLKNINYCNIIKNKLMPREIVGIGLGNSNHTSIIGNDISGTNNAITISGNSGNNTIDDSNIMLHNKVCDIFRDTNLLDQPTQGPNSISGKWTSC